MMRSYDFVTSIPLELDKHRFFLIEDVALTRTSPPISPFFHASTSNGATASQKSSGGMIERCVVVQRQKDGFGLTVTGDHPVYVFTVRPEGAAFCAGVRKGDRILKVNGMPVTSSNYVDVVRMISGGQNVALTLLGKPPEYVDSKSENDYVKPDIRPIRSIDQFRGSPKENYKTSPGLRYSGERREKVEEALKRVERLQSQLNLKSVCAASPESAIALRMHTSSTADLLANEGSYHSDDDELPNLDAQAPFTSIIELKSRPAHLALFLDYLISSANPASLFFYLITDAYQTSQATAKEFRRWAFEIFSTFLIPNGPLGIPSSDQSIIQPIDRMLTGTAQHVTESEGERLRKIFAAARQRALADVTDNLNEFRQKKEMGGVNASLDAAQLNALKADGLVEQRLGESKLMKQLEVLLFSASNDYDSCAPRAQAIISSLATVIRVVLGMKPSSSQWERMLDKCPTFLMKEKNSRFRMKSSSSKRNLQMKGHVFSLTTVNIVHYCYQCRDAIWGIQATGYFCLNCEVAVHKSCAIRLVDACYPATQKRALSKGKLTSSRKEDDDAEPGPSRQDPHNVKSTSSDSGIGVDAVERINVARSQSMRSRLSQMTSTTLSEDIRQLPRGRSALSWGADLTPADELDEVASRRNRSVESGGPRVPSDIQSVSGSSISNDEEQRMMAAAIADGDSDLEVDTEIPSIESMLDWEVIRHLKPKEKRRQEVINELFHTERTHVRNLKILHKIFYKPMLTNNTVSPDVLYLLFANIDEILAIHEDMNTRMRETADVWKKDKTTQLLYGDIGPLMEELFEGEKGEKLKEATSKFCQHQQHALDILRSRCTKKEKEDHFSRWLAEVESHPLCRKLQLKDMLPVEMQRLVKYPMLLETVAKHTQEDTEEQTRLHNVVRSAKKILSAVNTAKRNAENLRRLEELQRRMDTTPFDKENSDTDYASLDLTKYHLIHDGPLTLRLNRGKMQVELHVVLLEEILILLMKHTDGNKLLLKSLETGKDMKYSPIFPLSPLIVKEKANDKRAIFLLTSPESKGAHIFELVASTATERKTWLKLMSDQIEYVKKQPTQGIEPFKFEVGSASVDGEGPDKVQVLTHPRLVNANEITVQQPTILEHAEPVLTPTEKLKRSDQVIFQALLDKHKILASFLPADDETKMNRDEQLEKLTELLGGLGVSDLKQRDPKELAMSAIVHGNRLLDSINKGMQANKESEEGTTMVLVVDDSDKHLPSVPCYKLTVIAAPLMNHLKALMQVIQSQEAELSTVKQQLSRYKELADSSGCDRSVSEETLTDRNSTNSPAADGERKLMTRRNRTPSIPHNPPPPL